MMKAKARKAGAMQQTRGRSMYPTRCVVYASIDIPTRANSVLFEGAHSFRRGVMRRRRGS